MIILLRDLWSEIEDETKIQKYSPGTFTQRYPYWCRRYEKLHELGSVHSSISEIVACNNKHNIRIDVQNYQQ